MYYLLSFVPWFRLVCLILIVTFGGEALGGDAARAFSINEPPNIYIPPAGTLLPSSFAFSLPTLKGISIDPQDPFKLDFVVDSANQDLNERVNQEQVNLLIRYFLSFLTLPDEDLWVNLSPYEKNRIIISDFETTNAGRDMLVQDYILKQLASSLTYPDHKIGKIFWKKVYSRALAEYGSTDIPINTFSKVWVVPDRAVVYEDKGSAFISTSRLKVLTEEDYLSIEKNRDRLNLHFSNRRDIEHLSTEVTREIIIPELEREVNQGKYFAPLRQMYNSLILAIWFKKRLKENLISLVYVNQKKIYGIALNEKQIKEKIYAQYLRAYKKGVYNYIKEEPDPMTGQTIPRKYFSGGFNFVDTAMRVTFLPASRLVADSAQIGVIGKALSRITVLLKPLGISKKTLLSLAAGVAIMAGGIHQANADTNILAANGPALVQNVEIAPKDPKLSVIADPIIVNDVHKANEIVNDLNKIYSDDTKFSHVGSAIIHPIVPRLRKEREALKDFVSQDYVKGSSDNDDRVAIHNAAVGLDDVIHEKIIDWNSKVKPQDAGDLGNAIKKFDNTISEIAENDGIQKQDLNLPGMTPQTTKASAPTVVKQGGSLHAVKTAINVNLGRIGLTKKTPATTLGGEIANVILSPVRVVVSPIRAGVVAGIKEIGKEVSSSGNEIKDIPVTPLPVMQTPAAQPVAKLAIPVTTPNPVVAIPSTLPNQQTATVVTPFAPKAESVTSSTDTQIPATQPVAQVATQPKVEQLTNTVSVSVTTPTASVTVPSALPTQQTVTAGTAHPPEAVVQVTPTIPSSTITTPIVSTIPSPTPKVVQSPTVSLTSPSTNVTPTTVAAGGPPPHSLTQNSVPPITAPATSVDAPVSAHENVGPQIQPISQEVLTQNTNNTTSSSTAVSGGTPPPLLITTSLPATTSSLVVTNQPALPAALPLITSSVLTQQGTSNTVTNTVKPYSLTADITVATGEVVTKHDGIISDFDPNITDYHEWQPIFYLMDRELYNRIQSLQASEKTYKQSVDRWQELYSSGAATQDQLDKAKVKLTEIQQQLSAALTEKQTTAVFAPTDLRVREIFNHNFANGMNIPKGTKIFDYEDKDHVTVGVSLPLNEVYFGSIQNLTLDGNPLSSLYDLHWSLGPSQKDAQFSFSAPYSSASSVQGNNQLTLSILPPVASDPILDGIQGQARALGTVYHTGHMTINAQGEGKVDFFVQEGQRIKAGQLLARGDSGLYRQRAKQLKETIEILNARLAGAINEQGQLLTLDSDDVDRLIAQRATLWIEFNSLIDQIKALDYRATQDGIVAWVASHQSRVLKNNDPLIKIRTGQATVGDGKVEYSTNTLLFPKNLGTNKLDIMNGDPVVGIGPHGLRMIGEVVRVSPALQSTDYDLSNQQAVVVDFLDPHEALYTNLPVNVIYPKNGFEKQVLTHYLSEATARDKLTVTAGGAPPPDKDIIGNSIYNLTNSYTTNFYTITQTNTIGNGVASTLNQIETIVNSHPFRLEVGLYEVVSKKAAEGLNTPFKLTASFLGVYQNGQFLPGGQAGAALGNLVNASATGGPVLGAVSTVAGDLAGDLWGLVTKRYPKQGAVLKEQTAVATNEVKALAQEHFQKAKILSIRLVLAQKQIEVLRGLLEQLNHSKEIIQKQIDDNVRSATDISGIDLEISQVTSEINQLETTVDGLRSDVKLYLQDLSTNILDQLNEHWSQTTFEAISQEQMRTWTNVLLAPSSPNPEIEQARHQVELARRIKILHHNISDGPQIVVGNTYLSSGTGSDSRVNLSDPFPRTSTLQQGNNVGFAVGGDIVNGARKAEKKIENADLGKALANQNDVEQTKVGELESTVARINGLVSQRNHLKGSIASAEYNLQQEKNDKRHLLENNWKSDEENIAGLKQKLIGVEASILEEWTTLRRLNVIDVIPSQAIDRQTATVIDVNRINGIVTNAVLGHFRYNLKPLAIPTLPDESIQPTTSTVVSNLAAAEITFDFGNLPAPAAWALTQGGDTQEAQLKAYTEIAITDPNPVHRQQAVNHMVSDFPDSTTRDKAFERIVFNPNYSDVVSMVLLDKEKGKDWGIHYFVKTIFEAQQNSNQKLIDIAYRSLGSILTMHPEVLDRLRPSDFREAGTNQIFIGYLLRQPELSDPNFSKQIFSDPGADHLLKSGFWQSRDLKEIYHSLKNQPQDSYGIGRVRRLADLFDDLAGYKFEKSYVPEVFGKDGFDNPPKTWFSWATYLLRPDTITSLEISSFRQWDEDWLARSPQWRAPDGFIHPKMLSDSQHDKTNFLNSPVKTSIDLKLDQLSEMSSSHPELEYFLSLTLDEKRQFIAKTENIPLVATEILKLDTPVRGEILDPQLCPVMKDPQGQLLVLKTYTESVDPKVVSLVENYSSWEGDLKAHIPMVKGAANNKILRQSLVKLYGNTHNETYLNLLLLTYPIADLHVAGNDLQLKPEDNVRWKALVDAKIRVIAVGMAKQVLQTETDLRHRLWAGYSLRTPAVMDALDSVQHDLDTEINPQTILKNILDMQEDDTKIQEVRSMLKDLLSVSDKIEPKIANNDQRFPKHTLFWWAIAGLSGTIALWKIAKKSITAIKARIRHKEAVYRIIDLAKELTYLDKMDQRYGTGTIDPEDSMVEDGPLGYKIINFPEPNALLTAKNEEESQNKLKEWHRIITKWNRNPNLTSADLIEDMDKIVDSVKNITKTLRYTENMAESPIASHQKARFIMLPFSMYTLYLLKMRLKSASLTPEQSVHLSKAYFQFELGLDNFTDIARFVATWELGDIVTKRRLDEADREEKSGRFRTARRLLAFDRMWSVSRKRMEMSLKEALPKANALMGDGFYPNPDYMVREGMKVIDRRHHAAGMHHGEHLGTRKNELAKRISYYAREGKYVVQGIIMAIFDPDPVANIGFFWSWYWYAVPNLRSLDENWVKKVKNFGQEQVDELNNMTKNASDAAQVSLSENYDAAMATTVQNSTEINIPDEIDKRIISQLMSGYSADSAAPELLIPILQKNLSGEAENIIVENANLKKVFYLMRLFKEDSLLNRLKKTNSKEILWESSLKNREEFSPTTIENLNRDLEVIHINVGAREYYFIVGATYPTLVRMKDAAMNTSINRRGGVDFSKAEGSVVFQQISSAGSNSSLLNTEGTSLRSFKGFEFQVIQYRPILNPVEFFLGGKNSPLFLSKEYSVKYDQA